MTLVTGISYNLYHIYHNMVIIKQLDEVEVYLLQREGVIDKIQNN